MTKYLMAKWGNEYLALITRWVVQSRVAAYFR